MIPLTDPDMSLEEIEAVASVMKSPQLSQGEQVKAFETEFAAFLGRRQAVAVGSAVLGLLMVIRARGWGVGDELIASPYGWHPLANAIPLAGATPVFSDIDYWSGTLDPVKVAARITAATRALVVGNTNGHPASLSRPGRSPGTGPDRRL